jgi:plasmid stability protein
MSIITVRNLDPAAKRRIERRAAAHGRSMEAEIRDILESVPEPEPSTGFTAAMARVDLIMRDIEVEVDFPAREVEYQREVELA